MYDIIKKAAKDLYNFRFEMQELAQKKRENAESIFFPEMIEQDIIKEVKPLENYEFSIGAVDSGVYKRELHSFQIILVRTMASVFIYRNSWLSDSYNFPEVPRTEIELISEEEVDSIRLKNIIRLEQEISMAINLIKERDVNILFIDGSLLPLLSDRPKEESPIFSRFSNMCSLYKKMINLAMKKSILLAGIIKDARSNKFVKRIGVNKGVDTFFLDFFLRKGERTAAFTHTKEDPLLFKLIPQARDVLAFYIKPSEYDRPLRVEFIPTKYSFDEVASIIYTLSSISEHYAYPSVLFEVDKRVAIKKDEINAIEKQLTFYSDFVVSPLRRNSRPFKR